MAARVRGKDRYGEPLHELQAEDKMIGQHEPIAEGKPLQSTLRQPKLLMGSQQPYSHSGDTNLQVEKQRGAVVECHRQQRIRLQPAVLQMAQSQKRIKERAHEDKESQHHDTPRDTIDIRMVSLTRPPKAFSPASPV